MAEKSAEKVAKKTKTKFGEYILWFEEIGKKSIRQAGGKGANMGEMVRVGMPVPEGFVVNVAAFEHFLKTNKLDKPIKKLVKTCDVDNTENLNDTSAKIKRRIMDADMPLNIKQEVTRAYNQLSLSTESKTPKALQLTSAGREPAIVAVRSSATTEDLADASFAGQQASFLNVKGVPYLVDAIKRCWASLYEPRAIFYRAKKGFKGGLIAVIVQRMVGADKAGVTFTVNPSTGEDVVIHEATWGLGESLVLGKVNPDSYTVDKKTGEIIEKKIGKKEMKHVRDEGTGRTVEIPVREAQREQQVMSAEEIKELTELSLKLEKHYKHPQDIEWAVKGSKIYILQTRPVTTVGKKKKPKTKKKKKTPEKSPTESPITKKPKGYLLEGIAASPGNASGPVKVIQSVDESKNIAKGDVLVTEMTSPEYVPAMSKCVAIVTEKGGTTSHAAIVSREMGIPCIVGAEDATKKLKTGAVVTVDGDSGIIYTGKVKISAAEADSKPKKKEKKRPKKKVVAKKQPKKKPIKGKHKPKLYMNLGVVDKIDEYKSLPFEGIGLMRIEFIIAALGTHPNALIKAGESSKYLDAIADGVQKVAEAIHPRPVVVRFSDLKTNEYNELKGGAEFEPEEENPMIGWRGASRFISKEFEQVFRLECQAVKKVKEKFDNVWVMLPFVRTIEEVAKCMAIIESEGLKRSKKANFQVWIMAEVPSVVLLADDFSKICDGISIGSNDLTQLVLGVDRDSEILGKAGYFDEQNEAVKVAIKRLIKFSHKNGCTVSICGQAPSEYPEFVEFLVQSGIDSISVNPDAVEKTKEQIS